MSTHTTPEFIPVPRSERLDSIDFVRGVALLGILLVNAGSFFGPFADMLGTSRLAKMPAEDQLTRLLVNALCFTKFIGTFAMLFGFGLLTQCERAQRAGRAPWGFAARRLGALAVFGLVHAFVFWYGDILFVYALLGALVVVFRRVPADGLMAIGLTLLACAVGLRIANETFIVFGADLMPARANVQPAGDVRGARAIVAAGFNPMSPVWANAEIEAYSKGPWQDALTFRAVSWGCQISSIPFGMWWLVVGQFMMGMWLYKVRFFDPDQGRLRDRVLRICLPLGLLIEAVVALLCYSGLKVSPGLWAIGGALQAFSVMVLPLGYVAALSKFADAAPRWLISPVVCAGRMALTVYLGETLICTGLAYWWGLGWFGAVGPLAQVQLSLGIWAALVVSARLWLAVLPRGPMEVVRRLLEYGKA